MNQVIKPAILLMLFICAAGQISFVLASPNYYGLTLCQQKGYDCVKVKKGQSWKDLFPFPVDRDLVKRINRMNTPLQSGQTIAVPKHLTAMDKMDVSPFALKIPADSQKRIIVSLQDLAWGAYDANGQLTNWGPVSGGRDWCQDVGESCHTTTGNFHVIRAEGEECVSSKFPVETYEREAGGAVMPFCMFFNGGYALHGSHDVPGYNASHGCVRLFLEDARWLYYEFVEIPGVNGGSKQTKVIVE